MLLRTAPEKTPSWRDLLMILVIGSIRRSRQSFSKLVGNGSRSLEVLFDFMINFLISVSAAKVKVIIKKNMSSEKCTFWNSLSSENFEQIFLSTKKSVNFSQIVLSDRFSGKEGTGNL